VGALLVGALAALPRAGGAEPRRLLLIAGTDSHGYGAHEHGAGFRLFAELLNADGSALRATVAEGWPEDPALLATADAVAFYGDGGEGSLVSAHRKELEPLMRRGVGPGPLPLGPGCAWCGAAGGPAGVGRRLL